VTSADMGVPAGSCQVAGGSPANAVMSQPPVKLEAHAHTLSACLPWGAGVVLVPPSGVAMMYGVPSWYFQLASLCADICVNLCCIDNCGLHLELGMHQKSSRGQYKYMA
jgi:hypothetical protein